jgi:hypothetical protein
MPIKVVTGELGNNTIVVENTWFNGCKLIINNEIVSENSDYFAIKKNKAIMQAKIDHDGITRKVEVFVFAIFTVNIKIVVDGEYLAGDRF